MNLTTTAKTNLFLIGYGLGLIFTCVLDLTDELQNMRREAERERIRAEGHIERRRQLVDALRAERHQSEQLAARVRELQGRAELAHVDAVLGRDPEAGR